MDGQLYPLEVTWRRAVAVWWSLAWRLILFSALTAAIAAVAVGLLLVLIGRRDLADPILKILPYVTSVPVSIAVVRRVLRRNFRDFSIRLVSRVELG